MTTIQVPTDWQWVAESDPKEIAALIDRYRIALEDVVNPLGNLKRYAESQDRQLNGMAYSVANNLGFVQEIARKALTP